MRILVDTSIWIDHFRRSEQGLITLLHADQVWMANVIIGELVSGMLPRRVQTLDDLRRLPRLAEPSADEIFDWVEVKRLGGRGLSWADLSLAALSAFHDAPLWTRDRTLRNIASDLGLAHPAS